MVDNNNVRVKHRHQQPPPQRRTGIRPLPYFVSIVAVILFLYFAMRFLGGGRNSSSHHHSNFEDPEVNTRPNRYLLSATTTSDGGLIQQRTGGVTSDLIMENLVCCVQVDQSTVVVRETFGMFEPGCHFCLPWFLGSQVPGHRSHHLQHLNLRCETKTKDNVIVNVVASIQYRPLANYKATDASYKLSNTRTQIQAYVLDVIRASVPKLSLHDTLKQKNEIAKAVEEELEKAMSSSGYEIVQTLIVDIEPDEHVKRAMNEINAASARLRMAASENAEAEKILQIMRAEGEADSKYLSWLGIARQHQAIGMV